MASVLDQCMCTLLSSKKVKTLKPFENRSLFKCSVLIIQGRK